MRPLTVIFTAADRDRASSALALAAAHAALGAPTCVHFDAGAIPLLQNPTIVSAIGEASTLGATLSLCPSGIADGGIDAGLFPDADRVGLVTVLGEMADEARLVVI